MLPRELTVKHAKITHVANPLFFMTVSFLKLLTLVKTQKYPYIINI